MSQDTLCQQQVVMELVGLSANGAARRGLIGANLHNSDSLKPGRWGGATSIYNVFLQEREKRSVVPFHFVFARLSTTHLRHARLRRLSQC
jgi:hypothetical protein